MNKNILLGITGGIAAYKMVEVASSLTKMGNNVKVVMTENATKFITPMTFEAITHNSVDTELFDFMSDNKIKHITLAEEADLLLIAPASANCLARIANGMADDLLTSIILATQAKILISPAMNANMYKNNIVQNNIKYLDKMGFKIIKPDSGYLACGTEGQGRLPEPDLLIEFVIKELTEDKLKNKKVLITAGPTREPIDPVRFLSNYSSGKMGYALARAAWYQSADVTLISGPVALTPPPDLNLIEIETASELNEEVNKNIKNSEIIIMVAAVADYRPEKRCKEKIKKNSKEDLILNLRKNPDILKYIGNNKRDNQLIIGFAAESENILDNAQEKLIKKNLDMIIANNISSKDIGFNSEKNQVYIITNNIQKKLPLMKKSELSIEIINEIAKL